MLNKTYLNSIKKEMEQLKEAGLYKNEYQITSPQSAEIKLNERKLLNFCANNYLGLADNKTIIDAAKKAMDEYGFGTASVRFICGTMDVNRKLEIELAKFLQFEDVITFASCFTANNGIFQALLDENDAIISANLNHASIIDGIRLCKAKRYFYKFDDMADLEKNLQEANNNKHNKKLIVTDGVFSMDGDIADLQSICDLAEKYDAMIMVDDCHATGFIGKNGRGTAEALNVEGRIDILSSTTGKALGGASGGFIASKKEIIEKLRNQHRGYLFSNNLTPSNALACLELINIIKKDKYLIETIQSNTDYFRKEMVKAGFDIRPGIHPVAPVMIYDAKLAAAIAKDMIEKENIYVVAFSYPVVAKNEARIRVQISAGHTKKHIDQCIAAFIKVGKNHGLIKKAA